MITFEPLKNKYIPLIRDFLEESTVGLDKVLALMSTDPLSTLEVAFYEGGAVLKEEKQCGTVYFAGPIGKSEQGFRLIEEYLCARGGDLRFYTVDNDSLIQLVERYPSIETKRNRLVICSLSRPNPVSTVFTERLVIDDFTPADMAAYAALATDEARNEYWGYDYKVDLRMGETPDGAHFAKVLAEDAARGVSYSRKIAELSGAFVGEAVFYRFRPDGSAELGLRIAAEHAGKGYGREAFRALTEAALKRIPKVHARCFKENGASTRMILASGFTPVREEEDMLWFVRES